MKTVSEETTKGMANVLAGMVDEDRVSYYADAMYILDAIRSGKVPGVSIVECAKEPPEYDPR